MPAPKDFHLSLFSSSSCSFLSTFYLLSTLFPWELGGTSVPALAIFVISQQSLGNRPLQALRTTLVEQTTLAGQVHRHSKLQRRDGIFGADWSVFPRPHTNRADLSVLLQLSRNSPLIPPNLVSPRSHLVSLTVPASSHSCKKLPNTNP